MSVQEQPKQKFFEKILSSIDKTKKNIFDNINSVFKNFKSVDDELYENLEDALISADIGVQTSVDIINLLKIRVKKEKTTEPSDVKNILIEEISKILTSEEDEDAFTINPPTIILVIGVNGVGKTTTIGKLTKLYKNENKKVLLAAADTFRAAAIDQLEVWGERTDTTVIKHQEGSDPAAVVFDAVRAAKARKTDVLIIDTAGRLHNKKNLMNELSKIYKVIDNEFSDANKEVFLVLDATTGQNAMQQAIQFKEVANLTGLILTKLDGTAKGGIVIAIKNELQIPIRYIGVGEKVEDLQLFDANDFAKALFTE